MKTLLLVIGMGLVIIQANAQKMNAKDVPANVKSSLEKNYIAKDVDWDKEGANYEASFEQKGTEISVVFDGTGSILETEREIKKSALPSTILEALKKDYADFELEEAARIETKGVITYETEVEKGKMSLELVFDANGKLIKKEVIEEEDKD
ncbi:MAG: hypothetical protein DI539_18330 [Flavobacterium psychrophilum]|nr:MAG: hypothetical protein DI539_18330 [Flavobacterium psychrophilum]